MLPPLALYLHLPWCESKCPYCDFNSHTVPAPSQLEQRQALYLEAMCSDLRQQSAWVQDRPIETVFIGGGTPSLFSPAQIDQLLTTVRDHLVMADAAEITMEANPGSLERQNFSGYRRAGVNRLSIGGQSMNADALARLGRLHRPIDTKRAVQRAQKAGFERINVDLMYGLPSQTLTEAQTDVAEVLALNVRHVSHYQLTLEPNTRFFANPPELPNEDLLAEMMNKTSKQFEEAGLQRYEVSAFSEPGEECRHNLNYWRFGDYLGVGAGAHAKLTLNGTIYRYARPANPQGYTDSGGEAWALSEKDQIKPDSLAFEYMMNALRLADGFLDTDFERATGLKFASIAPSMGKAEQQGLISCDKSAFWRPTALGSRFLNDLIAIFLPD